MSSDSIGLFVIAGYVAALTLVLGGRRLQLILRAGSRATEMRDVTRECKRNMLRGVQCHSRDEHLAMCDEWERRLDAWQSLYNFKLWRWHG